MMIITAVIYVFRHGTQVDFIQYYVLYNLHNKIMRYVLTSFGMEVRGGTGNQGSEIFLYLPKLINREDRT